MGLPSPLFQYDFLFCQDPPQGLTPSRRAAQKGPGSLALGEKKVELSWFGTLGLQGNACLLSNVSFPTYTMEIRRALTSHLRGLLGDPDGQIDLREIFDLYLDS